MLGALLLVSGRPPDSIFLVALLTDRSPLGPQGCGLLTQEPLLSLPSRNDIRGGWFRWRRFWRLGAYRHKGLHCFAVGALRIIEHTPWIGWFGRLCAHAFHHQPAR